MNRYLRKNTARKILFAAFTLALTLGLSLAIAANTSTGAMAQTSTQQGTLVEFSARQGEARTKVAMEVERGKVIKVSATDADGTRNVPRLKPDAKLTLPCAEAEKSCESIRVLNGPTVNVCVCKAQTALLLPAVQKVREAAGGGGGGGACTASSPCCYEDHKLQMSICYP